MASTMFDLARKSSKMAAEAANSNKIVANTNEDVGPSQKKENANATPQCVMCPVEHPAHPSTAIAYARHLDKVHKSTLAKNDIYLKCECLIEVRSYYRNPKHKDCRLPFTLECTLCELEPNPTPKCVATKCKRAAQANRQHPVEAEMNEDTIEGDEESEMEEEEKKEEEEVKLMEVEEDEVESDEEEMEESSDDDEQENAPGYIEQGYHPVKIDEVFNDQYQIMGKLGFGVSATVWKCQDRKKNQFALKITTASFTQSENAAFEIKMLKHVRDANRTDPHPHKDKVVQLLDSFTTAGVNGTHMCMLIELLDCDLLKLIKQSKFKGIAIENVRIITGQMLKGLDYLHRKCKMIHTDIKPENVFVTMDKKNIKEVKIGDLGNACFTKEASTGQKIQTKQYRSVEVLVGAKFDATADIWSTACVTFELVTGDFLFNPEGDEEEQEDGRSESEADHLALIKQLLGPIPSEVYEKGRHGKKYFDENGELLHKNDLEASSLADVLGKRKRGRWNSNDASAFSSFLTPMLQLDQDNRVTAAQWMQHEWLQPKLRRGPAH